MVDDRGLGIYPLGDPVYFWIFLYEMVHRFKSRTGFNTEATALVQAKAEMRRN